MSFVQKMVFCHNIWKMRGNPDSQIKKDKGALTQTVIFRSFVKIFFMEAFKNMKRSSRKRITIINTYDLPKPCSRVQMIARTPTKTKTKLRLRLLLIIGNWNPKIIKIKKMRPTKFQIKILVLVKTSSSNKRHGSCTMLLIILQKQHRFNLNQGDFNK